MRARRVLTYLEQNVYDAALDRVRFVYDNCDDVIVAMSGGKDSTVCLHLARKIAAEHDRLPIKVFWLDLEAEWDATTEYMTSVMTAPDVKPYWFQCPMRMINAMSAEHNFLTCWDPAEQDKWVQPAHPLGIKTTSLSPPHNKRDWFFFMIDNLPSTCDVADKKHVGILGGMRIFESMGRRLRLTEKRGRVWNGNGVTA